MGTLIALPGVRERREDETDECRPEVTFGSVGQFAPLWQLPPTMRHAALAVGKTDSDIRDLQAGNLVAAIFFPDTTHGRVALPILVIAVEATPEEHAEKVLRLASNCYISVEYEDKSRELNWQRLKIPSGPVAQAHKELGVPVGKIGHARIRRHWAQLCSGGQFVYNPLAGQVKNIRVVSFRPSDSFDRECKTTPTEQVIADVATPVSVRFHVPVDQLIAILG